MNTPAPALAALAATLLPHLPATAQSVPTEWRVVAAESASIALPGLPTGSRLYTDALVGDTRGDQIGLRLTSPTASAGYWSWRPSGWVRYAARNTPGAMPGPGRSGNESAHVFVNIADGGSGAGADGQRLFIGRAGDPADSTTHTWGMWRWNGNGNVEILRALTDGVLGPGLGAGWVMQNDTTWLAGRALSGGRVAFTGEALSPTQAVRRVVALHVPGQGNRPCILRHSTDPALSPGITPGDSFNGAWSLSDIAMTPDARVYGNFDATSRNGIWEICNGPPRAIAVNGESGARGPHLGIGTATFDAFSFTTPRLGEAGQFYFFSAYRTAPSQSPRTGLFWHDGQVNRPLAINGDGPAHGPGWLDTTWRTFDTGTLTSAGSWAAFSATVNTTDGGNPGGLWRVRAGSNPELVALLGLTGQYGPEPNRTWQNFPGRVLLANGDLIVLARTNPGSELAYWLLRQGQPPRRLLKVGDTLTVTTTSGPSSRTVTDLSVVTGIAQHNGGQDSWAAADGTILIQATLSGLGKVHLLSRPSDPGVLFANGFEN